MLQSPLVARFSRAVGLAVFATGCLLPLWTSLGDHALYGRSDGRYAAVSAAMASTGDWLVPRLEGHPHLTKPPLTYWLEALCIRLLGQNELAVRLPSAIANTLLILGVLALTWNLAGYRRALVAAGLLSLMPLQVMLGRLTLTDPLLSLAWFGVLAASLLAVHRPRQRRWPMLLYLSITVGLLAKGPLILVPLAIVALWLALARHGSAIRRFRLRIGLPVAFLPLLIWGLLILLLQPEALRVWLGQTVGRFSVTADHPEPPWYFLPVFLAGLFPATAAMGLPVFNYGWRRSWSLLCNGSDQSLWALAVLAPLLMFSLITGKLPSYLLPLAAPLAIVTSAHIERWLVSQAPPAQERWPEFRLTLLIGLSIGVVVATVVICTRAGLPYGLWMPGPAGLAMVLAALGVALIWRFGASARAVGLVAAWAIVIASWLYFLEIEDRYLEQTSTRSLLRAVARETRLSSPSVVTMGYEDFDLPFYAHPEARRVDTADELEHLATPANANLLIIADARDWARLASAHPETAARFQPVLRWAALKIAKPRLVLRLRLPLALVP